MRKLLRALLMTDWVFVAIVAFGVLAISHAACAGRAEEDLLRAKHVAWRERVTVTLDATHDRVNALVVEVHELRGRVEKLEYFMRSSLQEGVLGGHVIYEEK